MLAIHSRRSGEIPCLGQGYTGDVRLHRFQATANKNRGAKGKRSVSAVRAEDDSADDTKKEEESSFRRDAHKRWKKQD